MFILAFDCESFGGIAMRNGIAELGAALIDMKAQTVVARASWNVNQAGFIKSEKCMEFWNEHPEQRDILLAKCEASKLNAYDVMDLFWAQVREWNKTYPIAYLVTDNAAYDAGMLRCFSANDDILTAIDGTYREIVQSTTWMYGTSREKYDGDKSSYDTVLLTLAPGKPKPVFDVEHDHNAANDAAVIGLEWAYVQSLVQ